PEPGEGCLGADERHRVRAFLLVDVAEDALDRLDRRHQQGAAGNDQTIEGLQAVPGPGLDAFGQGVVHADGDVHVLGLVPGHVLLEFFFRIGDDGEVLRRDAVTLWTVAVAPEGDAPPPRFSSAEHDPARDPRGQVLLEDSAIYDLTDQG